MSADGLVPSQSSGLNYLEHPATAAYFEAREHEAYYRALKHAGQRRDFHERLIPVCSQFVEVAELGANAQLIDELIAATARSATAPGALGLLTEAEALHPDGFRLLQLKNPIDFGSLKSAYRRAARQHHPDTGGTTEAMKAVNEAYVVFHELLRRHQVLGGVSEDGEPRVCGEAIVACRDYQYILGVLLLQVTLDDWNVDGALEWFDRLASAAWSAARGAVDPWQRIQLIEPCARLAVRLHLAGQFDAARRVLKESVRCLTVARAKGLNFEFYVRDAEAALDRKKKVTVTLNHHRQAENALRLGVIDQKRYDRVMARLVESEHAQSQVEIAFRAFVAEGGFVRNLPTDGMAQTKIVRAALVPEPGYYVNCIESLTDDQQAEYVAAFGLAPRLDLVVKYIFVRLNSLFRSAILCPRDVALRAAERECRALARFQGGSLELYATDVADALAYLDGLANDEQEIRLELLKSLDQRKDASERIQTGGITITVSSGVSPFAVDYNPEYLKLVRLPLSELRRVLATGCAPESEGARREAAAWSREVNLLRTPEFEDSQGAAFAALDASKSTPEHTVEVLARHCERLIAMGDGMVHVEELQLGYWVDKLTIALTRLKRWEQSAEWLERYFSLSVRYRQRSSASEEGGMRRRLERCKKLLG